MTTRVAINGFGRVGRAAFRAAFESGADVEWVAINDIVGAEALGERPRARLGLRCVSGRDRARRRSDLRRRRRGAGPSPRPTRRSCRGSELGVDVVLECTGRFRSRADAAKHLAAGARKVIVSAPMKDADATVVLGVNFPDAYDPRACTR